MIDLPRIWRRLLTERGLALALSASVALSATALGQHDSPMVIAQAAPAAQQPEIQGGTVEQTAPKVYTLGLAECIAMALDRQPALAAHRASLAAAHNASVALEKLHIPTFIARDLPVRRQQACLGISVASAALEQAEYDTVYAVTRLYYGVIFAREQEKVAQETVDRLKLTQDTIKRHKDAGKDVTEDDFTKVTVYFRLAESKLIQASEGANRSLAALREAIGVGPDCCIQVLPGPLPDPQWQICRDDIIGWALTRRGELVQAGLAAEITSLEVDAQGTTHRPKKETFAAGADIHGRQVPQGYANGEYRPGAIPPEMPTLLAGCKSQRMERARSFSARAAAVADKTRNLIALDAEDAYLKWVEASRKVPGAREAARLGHKLAEDRLSAYRGDANASIADVLNDRILGAQARAQLNEVLYQQILALAALERATAGGFSAGLAVTPADAQPTNPQAGSEKVSLNKTMH